MAKDAKVESKNETFVGDRIETLVEPPAGEGGRKTIWRTDPDPRNLLPTQFVIAAA